MSDPAPNGNPPRRFWLLAPFFAILLALAAVCAGWWYVRLQIEDGLRSRAHDLGQRGYAVELGPIAFGGFPYRMEVDLQQARITTPSGWALAFPELKGEALLFDLGHWVFVAPSGLVFTRPVGCDVVVTGTTLRASLAGMSAPVPRFAFEGVDLRFSRAPGARPFSLATASRLELYTRTGVRDPKAAEALIRLEGGRLTSGTLASLLVRDHAFGGALSLRLTRFDAMRGESWSAAGRAWAAAGGRLEVDPTSPPEPDLQLSTPGGVLSFDPEGHPSGALPIQIAGPGGAHAFLAPLAFDDGKTRLGPLTLGPAPRAF